MSNREHHSIVRPLDLYPTPLRWSKFSIFPTLFEIFGFIVITHSNLIPHVITIVKSWDILYTAQHQDSFLRTERRWFFSIRKCITYCTYCTTNFVLGSRDKYSGKAVDIWAMGVTLFCFIYGKVSRGYLMDAFFRTCCSHSFLFMILDHVIEIVLHSYTNHTSLGRFDLWSNLPFAIESFSTL